MAAVTIHSDFAAQENKVWHYSIVSPCISREVMRRDAMILVFWLLSFKPSFSLSSFTFVKRFFSSPSLSDIKVVSPAYLKLLIFLLTILIPACASSHPAFHMMFATYKLNKQGDNTQRWPTPFTVHWTSTLFHVQLSLYALSVLAGFPVLTSLSSWFPYYCAIRC